MANYEWEQNGSNWLLKTDKGYGFVMKAKAKGSYKIEVSRNGLFKSLGKKQSLEWAKRIVEQYFGVCVKVEVLQYKSPTVDKSERAKTTAQPKTTASQAYRSKYDMCELWYNKE